MVYKPDSAYNFDLKAGLLVLVIVLSLLLASCQCKESEDDFRSDVKTLICK